MPAPPRDIPVSSSRRDWQDQLAGLSESSFCAGDWLCCLSSRTCETSDNPGQHSVLNISCSSRFVCLGEVGRQRIGCCPYELGQISSPLGLFSSSKNRNKNFKSSVLHKLRALALRRGRVHGIKNTSFESSERIGF